MTGDESIEDLRATRERLMNKLREATHSSDRGEAEAFERMVQTLRELQAVEQRLERAEDSRPPPDGTT